MRQILCCLLSVLLFTTVAQATDINLCPSQFSALTRAEGRYNDAYRRHQAAYSEYLRFRDERQSRLTVLGQREATLVNTIPAYQEQKDVEIRLAERNDRFCIICEDENAVRARWDQKIAAAEADLATFQVGYETEVANFNLRLARYAESEQQAQQELDNATRALDAARQVMLECGAVNPSTNPRTKCSYESREVEIAVNQLASLEDNVDWAERNRFNTSFDQNLRRANAQARLAQYRAQPGVLSQQKDAALRRIRRDNPFCFNICRSYIFEQANYDVRIANARWSSVAYETYFALETMLINLRILTANEIEAYFVRQVPPARDRLAAARSDLLRCTTSVGALRSASRPLRKNKRCSKRKQRNSMGPCPVQIGTGRR